VANFFVAGNAGDRGGVRLAVKDADGDGRADVVAGSGEGSPSKVRIYLGKNFAGGGEPTAFQNIDPFGTTLPGGGFVG
jgi:ABC-type sugar transport system substrate-binding protein